MKHINEYFSQSEKISSIDEYLLSKRQQKANSIDMENPHEMGCLVEAAGSLVKKLDEYFTKITPKYHTNYYVPELYTLSREDAKECIDPKRDAYCIYEVPEEYDTFEKFEEFIYKYEYGDIKLKDLKEIYYDDL